MEKEKQEALNAKQKQMEMDEGSKDVDEMEEMDEIAMEKLRQKQQQEEETGVEPMGDESGSEDNDMCDITRERLPEVDYQGLYTD